MWGEMEGKKMTATNDPALAAMANWDAAHARFDHAIDARGGADSPEYDAADAAEQAAALALARTQPTTSGGAGAYLTVLERLRLRNDDFVYATALRSLELSRFGGEVLIAACRSYRASGGSTYPGPAPALLWAEGAPGLRSGTASGASPLAFRGQGYRIPSSIRFRPFTAAINSRSCWWLPRPWRRFGGRRMDSVFDSIRGAGF
jgi:hypothetical protein